MLNNPSAVRMPCHIAMKDTLSVMSDDKEAVQHSEGQSRHGEEIHRGEGFPMIVEKCCPSFPGE